MGITGIKPARKQSALLSGFSDKTGFISGLSVIDLIMHEGPEAWKVLCRQNVKNELQK